MPNPQHHLVTFRGHFGTVTTARESWSFGLRFRPSLTGIGAAEGAPLSQGVTDAMRDAWALAHQQADLRVISTAWFDECRAYLIGEDGRAVDEPRIARMTTPVAGATTNVATPWQSTVALTLDAGYPAKGRYGRFYMPTQSFTIDDTGLIALNQATAAFNIVKTFLNSVSNVSGPDTGFGIVVVGGTGAGGTMRDVEQVRMGRVVDTQRRRRRQVAEAYLSSSFTP